MTYSIRRSTISRRSQSWWTATAAAVITSVHWSKLMMILKRTSRMRPAPMQMGTSQMVNWPPMKNSINACPNWFNLVVNLVSFTTLSDNCWQQSLYLFPLKCCAVDESLEEDMQRQLHDILQNISQKTSTGTNDSDAQALIDNLQKTLDQNGDPDGGGGGDEELEQMTSLFSNIVGNLLSKDFLYPSLSDLSEKVGIHVCNIRFH